MGLALCEDNHMHAHAHHTCIRSPSNCTRVQVDGFSLPPCSYLVRIIPIWVQRVARLFRTGRRAVGMISGQPFDLLLPRKNHANVVVPQYVQPPNHPCSVVHSVPCITTPLPHRKCLNLQVFLPTHRRWSQKETAYMMLMVCSVVSVFFFCSFATFQIFLHFCFCFQLFGAATTIYSDFYLKNIFTRIIMSFVCLIVCVREKILVLVCDCLLYALCKENDYHANKMRRGRELTTI